jgi:hypothetical protein
MTKYFQPYSYYCYFLTSLRDFRWCSWDFFSLVVVRLGFVFGYRHFGTAYWSILQRSSSQRRIFFLDCLNNVLDQNVCNQLPNIATQHKRKTEAKCISHWLFKRKMWEFLTVRVISTDNPDHWHTLIHCSPQGHYGPTVSLNIPATNYGHSWQIVWQ